MNFESIKDIRILPNDKRIFPSEEDFYFFITRTMIKRGGYYYFPKHMMRSGSNTLVLFQYDNKIRAYGFLNKAVKEESIDPDWPHEHYSGYYVFDPKTLCYLDEPIDGEALKKAWPGFRMFCQTKQRISLQFLDKIVALLG